MIRLIAFLVIVCAIFVMFLGYRAWRNRHKPKFPRPSLFACACGCDRLQSRSDDWDGYHGPDYNNPMYYDPNMMQYRPLHKAIDKPDDYVLGWQDIEWTVERRLPKED